MSLGGLLFCMVSWAVILLLMVFCFYRVFQGDDRAGSV